MADPEHLEILMQGVAVWNRWREENPDIRPDLSHTNLNKKDLSQINFHEAFLFRASLMQTNFTRANFIRADLSSATLWSANLSQAILNEAKLRKAALDVANLSEAELCKANLRWANLQFVELNGANFAEADLRFANLSKLDLFNVNLSGANLSGAKVGWTIFRDIDLSTVKGLDMMKHEAPSYIDIYTLYHYKGKLPEEFLRGIGVPDTWITSIISLTGKTIQYYSCFISYSHKDQAFVQKLHDDLQNSGVRCWFAPEDMKIGDKIRPTIDQSIRAHDKLLLVLSEKSVASQWVEQEVETALERERKQDEKVLFPVRLDETVMEIESGWPALMRNTRHIGDFSRWKDHDAYQAAFERLLRDLKAEE